jgi:CHAT domain-containing protein
VATASVVADRQHDAEIDAAYALLEKGQTEAGFNRLHAALMAAAKTADHARTMRLYTEAGRSFYESGLPKPAAILFQEGAETAAAQADNVRERADFFLAYAEFRTEVQDPGQHFVPLYAMATNLYAKYYGKESVELINATDSMARALSLTGQYGTAIDVGRSNYQMAQKVLGDDAPTTWLLANNLADMLRGLGLPAQALTYDLAVLEKRTAHYGRVHRNRLVSANNTAQDYLALGDYKRAQVYFDLCLAIARATKDKGNITAMQGWIDYVDLLSGSRKIDAAALARLQELTKGADYPGLLQMKAAYLLADHYARAGDQQQRLAHLQTAYAITQRDLGPGHPLSFAARMSIAKAQADAGDMRAAASGFAAVDRDMLRWVQFQASVAGGRDVGEALRAMADDMLFDYARLALNDATIAAGFADAARHWPFLATADADNLLKLSRLVPPGDVETTDLLDRIPRLTRIAQEIFAADTEQELAYGYLGEAKGMERQLDAIVRERYKLDRRALLAKPLPDPAALLAPDQAMIQYFTTRQWGPDRQAEEPLRAVELYAIVWRNGKPPLVRALGDPRSILAASGDIVDMVQMGQGDGGPLRGQMAGTELFQSLHAKLLAPLSDNLGGADTLFIVPDGQLFALPFPLLADEQGRLLEQRYTIRMLTEPEALYRADRAQTLPKVGRMTLAGGIDYSKGEEVGANPLPGTKREVAAIQTLLSADPGRKIDLLTGADAGEAALRRAMEGARLAHLATHGAYGSAKNGGASTVDTLWQSEVILARSGDDDPMRRDGDDGRLYAFELMSWDLTGMDLLVLSACETGRGDETFLGGVRGLPVAASLAGVKRSLLTLWPVADVGTADFMQGFYKNLKAGQTYAEALRTTRRQAMEGAIPTARDPSVWAAFVLFEN